MFQMTSPEQLCVEVEPYICLQVAQNWWLSWWAEAGALARGASDQSFRYLFIYAIFGIVAIALWVSGTTHLKRSLRSGTPAQCFVGLMPPPHTSFLVVWLTGDK